MHEANEARGLRILANPCNQFGGQEPHPEDQIRQFCTQNYNVSFPLLGKCNVKDESVSPLYQYLKAQAPDAEIKWNFAKYLLNGEGQFVKFFEHGVDPDAMMDDINGLLNEQ